MVCTCVLWCMWGVWCSGIVCVCVCEFEFGLYVYVCVCLLIYHDSLQSFLLYLRCDYSCHRVLVAPLKVDFTSCRALLFLFVTFASTWFSWLFFIFIFISVEALFFSSFYFFVLFLFFFIYQNFYLSPSYSISNLRRNCWTVCPPTRITYRWKSRKLTNFRVENHYDYIGRTTSMH